MKPPSIFLEVVVLFLPFPVSSSENKKIKHIGVCALVFGFPLCATEILFNGIIVITFFTVFYFE